MKLLNCQEPSPPPLHAMNRRYESKALFQDDGDRTLILRLLTKQKTPESGFIGLSFLNPISGELFGVMHIVL